MGLLLLLVTAVTTIQALSIGSDIDVDTGVTNDYYQAAYAFQTADDVAHKRQVVINRAFYQTLTEGDSVIIHEAVSANKAASSHLQQG